MTPVSRTGPVPIAQKVQKNKGSVGKGPGVRKIPNRSKTNAVPASAMDDPESAIYPKLVPGVNYDPNGLKRTNRTGYCPLESCKGVSVTSTSNDVT